MRPVDVLSLIAFVAVSGGLAAWHMGAFA
jgi:hypothetical protein